MRLLRATCVCGFQTGKAREGYHFHKWWFPVFVQDTGHLHDVSRHLPEHQVELIQRGGVESRELHRPFIDSVTAGLVADYSSRDNEVLEPSVGESFKCPRCSKLTLRIGTVRVTALCKGDCRHEYDWLDSENRGCTLCNHRPHRFRVDCDVNSDVAVRIVSQCFCSSSMESGGHVDAYCPKCGELPVSYQVNGRAFCGIHHREMKGYRLPGGYLFMQASAQFVKKRFPNAKFWGDCNADDALSSAFCQTCEADHQAWLELHEER